MDLIRFNYWALPSQNFFKKRKIPRMEYPLS